MSSKTKTKTDKRMGFVRATVTIPEEIAPFAEEQAAKPEHAGNFSSYVRSLILRDREAAGLRKQAA